MADFSNTRVFLLSAEVFDAVATACAERHARTGNQLSVSSLPDGRVLVKVAGADVEWAQTVGGLVAAEQAYSLDDPSQGAEVRALIAETGVAGAVEV